MASPSIWDIILAAIGSGPLPMADSTSVTLASDQTAINVITVAGSAGSLQLKTAVYGPKSITSTPAIAKVGASNLTNRITLSMNPTNGTVYMGFDSSVSSTTGTPIEGGSAITIDATATLNVYLVTASGTVDVRLIEGSDQ